MVKPRNYREEYKDFHGRPEEVKKRAMRNQARAEVAKRAGAAAIAGKDVHHKKALRHGGGNGNGNLAIASVHKNRGYESEKKR